MQNQTLAQAEREISVYTGRKPLGHTEKVRAKNQNLNQWVSLRSHNVFLNNFKNNRFIVATHLT